MPCKLYKILLSPLALCNIEKSRLLFISKDNSFDPSAWIGEIVPKGVVVRHLGAPIGMDISDKQRFEWILQKVRGKMQKWRFVELSFWGQVKVIKVIMMSYIMFYVPFISFNQTRWNAYLKPIKLFLWRKSFLKIRAINWLSWNSVCKPKALGGLSILHMPSQASALHAKFVAAFQARSQQWVSMMIAILKLAKVRTEGGSWKDISWS